ncbi:hypothetical protein IPJ91_02170 [bacterium]|nr:MAG: hypothetical protein IPJ91_02170 [bacterium]
MKTIIIFGPTSSGKTKLAFEVAKHLNNNVEAISADSRQVYKSCQIGTGSIDNKIFEEFGIKLHLTEFLEPNEDYSVSMWQKSAYELVERIKCQGKVCIIIGGTGLYIDSLLYNREYGNDLQPFCKDNILFLTPDIERNQVYENINNRVEEMFEMGFVDEVRHLINLFDSSTLEGVKQNLFDNKRDRRGLPAILQGAGYKQILEYLDTQEILNSGRKVEIVPRFRQKYILDLETCKEKVKVSYRNYAKRQYTWFRKYFEEFEVEKIKI